MWLILEYRLEFLSLVQALRCYRYLKGIPGHRPFQAYRHQLPKLGESLPLRSPSNPELV
jgi:hypothetical protein